MSSLFVARFCERISSTLRACHGDSRRQDLAAAVCAHRELALGTGVLVANPVPEKDEMPREIYDGALGLGHPARRVRPLR